MRQIAGVCYFTTGALAAFVLALAGVRMAIPMADAFRVSCGWPQHVMIGATVAFGALALLSVGFLLAGSTPIAPLCHLPLPWLFIGSQIAANVLMGVSPPR